MAVSRQHFESMAGPLIHDESVTQTEFARRVGCSQPNISKLIKSGKIFKNEKGRLNFYEALRAYEENTDPNHHERLNKESSVGESLDLDLSVVSSVSTGDKFKQARAKREEHSANLVELKFAKESGELINASKVEKDAFNLGRGLRDSLASLPERLAPILAAEQDDRKVASILEVEINKALNGFVAASEKLKTHAGS